MELAQVSNIFGETEHFEQITWNDKIQAFIRKLDDLGQSMKTKNIRMFPTLLKILNEFKTIVGQNLQESKFQCLHFPSQAAVTPVALTLK